MMNQSVLPTIMPTVFYCILKNVIDHYKNNDILYDFEKEVYRDSIIKKYEILEDLSWKLLAKLFKESGLEGSYL
jgi:hypothetical protein